MSEAWFGGQPSISPCARELAAKNAYRLTTGREPSWSDVIASAWLRTILTTVAIAMFTGICGAQIGGAVGGGSTASIVIGAVVMIVAPIPFAVAAVCGSSAKATDVRC